MFFTKRDKKSKVKAKKIEELYIKYKVMMYRIAYSILNDKILSEDVVQQAFITIMINFDKFEYLTEGRAKGLLIIITKNACLNILKRRKIIDFVSFDHKIEESIYENQLEDIIITNECYSSLLKEISHLDKKYSSVLQLKFIYGYTNSEIAKLLKISNETVRVRIFRARRMMIKCLKSEELSYE